MCGIYGCFKNGKITLALQKKKYAAFCKSHARGPDVSVFKRVNNKSLLGFHRLAIMDIENGGQPFYRDGVYCICNGEIYNYKQLIKDYNLPVKTNSDCEVLLHLYFERQDFATLLDGVFAFVIYDTVNNIVFAGRDPIGVRSLYYTLDESGLEFSSEMKSLDENKTIEFFPPGQTMMYDFCTTMFDIYYNYCFKFNNNTNFEIAKQNLKKLLTDAVNKRLMSDRPIGCLLSGGLDSSLIAALLAKNFPEHTLHTFSIGMEGGTDLKYAKMVADHIKSVHHEVIVTPEDMLKTLPKTIERIESWDTTTVRASTPMILLCDYIKEHTDITVIYSGEGSDEASGSYMYFHNAPDNDAFHNETVRLVKDLQYFDVLRCDKSISGSGLEARVPFLDKDFLEYYMSLHPSLKHPVHTKNIEKYLLRCVFDDGLLPKEVLWRQKEAFSDGCSSQENSWFSMIQDHCKEMIFDESIFNDCIHKPMTQESKYYKKEFLKHYSKNKNIIPYYWLPKWSGDIFEPSARVLDAYDQ